MSQRTSLYASKISFNFWVTVPKIQVSTPGRHRYDTNFADTDVDELVAMLRETENLEEQGDILQYLVDTQGLDYNTGKLGFVSVSVKLNVEQVVGRNAIW